MAFKIYYDNNHVLTKNKNSFTLFEEWNEHENNEYKEIKQKTKKNNEIKNYQWLKNIALVEFILKWLAIEYVGKCWYLVLFVLKYWFKSMRKLILLQEIRCRLNTCAISKICLKYLPQLPKYSTLNILIQQLHEKSNS